MEEGRNSLQNEALPLKAQIASVLVEPLRIAADPHCNFEPFFASEIKLIAQNEYFRRPLNRAFNQKLGLDRFTVSVELLDRLDREVKTRLAVLMSCAANETCDRAARQLAAAMLHKRILQVVLKPRRELVRSVIGDEPYNTAIREASMLYAPLAMLDNGSSNRWLEDGHEDTAQAAAEFLAIGHRAMYGFVTSVEPELGPLFALRLASEADAGTGLSSTGFDDILCGHVLKLMRRKVPEWSAFIT